MTLWNQFPIPAPLQWRHMSVMAWQLHCFFRSLFKRIHWSTGGFPHKGPVTRNTFPCHGLSMLSLQLRLQVVAMDRETWQGKPSLWRPFSIVINIEKFGNFRQLWWVRHPDCLNTHGRSTMVSSVHRHARGVLTIFWVTGRLGPFDPPFSTYVEFWPLLLGSDVEYWPLFFQAL